MIYLAHLHFVAISPNTAPSRFQRITFCHFKNLILRRPLLADLLFIEILFYLFLDSFSLFISSCLQNGSLYQHVKERFRKFSDAKVQFDWYPTKTLKKFCYEYYYMFLIVLIFSRLHNKKKDSPPLRKVLIKLQKAFSIENCPISQFFDWPNPF